MTLSAALISILLYTSINDYRNFVITNRVNCLILLLGLTHVIIYDVSYLFITLTELSLVFSILYIFEKIYRYVRKSQGLGYGDIKFLSAATCWVGIMGIIHLLLLACLSALIFLTLKKMHGETIALETRIAFGPHLCLGLSVIWILQNWAVWPAI